MDLPDEPPKKRSKQDSSENNTGDRLIISYKRGSSGRIIIQVSGTIFIGCSTSINETDQSKIENSIKEGINSFIHGESFSHKLKCNIDVKFITSKGNDTIQVLNECINNQCPEKISSILPLRQDSETQISKGVMIVLTQISPGTSANQHEQIKAKTTRSGSPDSCMIYLTTSPDMKTIGFTAAHEFGHLLGIDKHSLDPTNLMFRSDDNTLFNKYIMHPIVGIKPLDSGQLEIIFKVNLKKSENKLLLKDVNSTNCGPSNTKGNKPPDPDNDPKPPHLTIK